MSPAAFDAIAGAYDADFTTTPLGALLRERLWTLLDQHLPTDGQLLELGCGTGHDAVHLAGRGARVWATDQSEEMLSVARKKAEKQGVQLQTAALDLAAPALPKNAPGQFDGAWSSFGPLNCIADRGPLWQWLTTRIRPGGTVVLVVMAPLAPWDWLWFGAHGQLRAATRRRGQGGRANAGAGSTVRVWYPSWRTLASEAAASFSVVHTEGLGVLLPISEAGHLVGRFPRLFGAAAQLEARIAGLPPCRSLCDHYALVLRRRDASGA
ncbi:MAG: class I SAM-dependent methyltransferase [Myxococcales bacterium]|nr:class I SAM-dependent methyltransferase [Myxococcales bacterium]